MSDFFKTSSRELIPRVDIATNYKLIDTQSKFSNFFDEIMDLPYWVFDTETTGKDPHKDKVILMQIGNRSRQFLIDTREVEIKRLAERMEDESFIKVGQYLQFDYLMMLGSFGMRLEGIRDTFLAEKLITAGIQDWGFSMEDMAIKYLNVELDKTLQKSFINHTGPFSQAQLNYAALDCIIPDHILTCQVPILKRENLLEVFKIECNAVPAFGDSEYYGMLLDKGAWIENIEFESMEAERQKEIFLEAMKPHVGVDMMGYPDINPNSPQQVLKALNELYPGEMVDREGKPGTGYDILIKVAEKHEDPPEIMSLIKVREHEKKIGTYGYTYIDHIHPKTGRFHPRIDQIGTETGRPAGKKPNMLNIPAEARYRHPWIAGPGRKILTNDYGACELRIMASMSGDPVMCKGFNEGLDYHTFTASQFITDPNEFMVEFIPGKEPGKGKYGDFILDEKGNKIPNPNFGKLVSYDQVTKAQRDVAKTINFGLAYGMGAKKLADTLKISRQLAKEYIEKFNATFRVLVDWLKKNQELAWERGYAETYLGRKRYFEIPKTPPILSVAHKYTKIRVGWKEKNGKNWPVFKYVAEGMKTLDFNPLDPWDENLPDTLRRYYQRQAGIKREGGNSPIQGGNADITKIAMYELRKWIRNYEKQHNNDQYLAHVCLQVYDEVLVDCPEFMAEEMAKTMDRIMKEAGERVITQVPVETGCIIADSWVK